MKDSSFYQQILELHRKYEKWMGPLFFFLGFIFDIFTLGRIDDLLNILSQGLYLIILFTFLNFEFTAYPSHKKLEKVFEFKDEIFHFILGALLSAFTLFYFKSASLSASFLFMFLILALLVMNESQRFQKLGLLVKSSLLYLCLLTYCLYLIPLIIGKVGFFPFIFSLTISLIILFLYLALLSKKGVERKKLEDRLLFPSIILMCFFIVFYLFKIIPPIPLSTQHIGVYHNVEKNYPEYKVSHEKPWWKIWHTGDQDFKAAPGDKIYIFTRVFAPAGFDDKIFLHFLYKTEDGYKTSDKIPLPITGGRGKGFRGFAYKSNYSPGDWKVQIETANGLEIGRISFTVEIIQETQRVFKTEVH